jgi:hypothetical protein
MWPRGLAGFRGHLLFRVCDSGHTHAFKTALAGALSRNTRRQVRFLDLSHCRDELSVACYGQAVVAGRRHLSSQGRVRSSESPMQSAIIAAHLLAFAAGSLAVGIFGGYNFAQLIVSAL